MIRRVVRPERIKRFAAVFVGDPGIAKRTLYESAERASHFSGESCVISGFDILLELDVLLFGAPWDKERPRNISVLQPDGPLNFRSPVARHLYLISPEFCSRLAQLTDERMREIAADWYRLLYPSLTPGLLERKQKRAPYNEKALRALTELARIALKRDLRLMAYVEHRRDR